MKRLAILLFVLSSTSFAGTIYHITPTYPVGLNSTIQSQLDEAFNELQTEVNTNLPDAEASEYLKGVSNATVMAQKGQGADYSGNMSVFTAGLSLGMGVSTNGETSMSDVLGGSVDANTFTGFGASSTVALGLNLGVLPFSKIGFIDLKRMSVFVNFLSLSLPSSIKGVKGKISSLGAQVQYKIVEGNAAVPFGVLKWNGVDVTTGIQHTGFNFSITQTVNAEEETTISSLPATVSFSNDITVGAEISTTTIPLEISTSAQVLYFLSPYIGFGVDMNFGSSTASVSGDGPVDITGTGIPVGVSANSELSIGDSGSPSFINGRLFYGAQLNLSVLKLYFQMNQGLGNDAFGVTVGTRIMW